MLFYPFEHFCFRNMASFSIALVRSMYDNLVKTYLKPLFHSCYFEQHLPMLPDIQ